VWIGDDVRAQHLPGKKSPLEVLRNGRHSNLEVISKVD
jgi:hypothetical protein